MQRPQSNEYFDYYGNYVRLVPDGDLFEIGKSQPGELRACLEFCTESQSEELHPPYTWTVKQVIGHLIDTERIFADRFHRFSCNDLQALPGFDQNEYVDNCNYQLPKLSDLLDEFESCRRANLLLMQRVRPNAWANVGTASGHPVTVRALAFMIVGHVIHHLQILQTRSKQMRKQIE